MKKVILIIIINFKLYSQGNDFKVIYNTFMFKSNAGFGDEYVKKINERFKKYNENRLVNVKLILNLCHSEYERESLKVLIQKECKQNIKGEINYIIYFVQYVSSQLDAFFDLNYSTFTVRYNDSNNKTSENDIDVTNLKIKLDFSEIIYYLQLFPKGLNKSIIYNPFAKNTELFEKAIVNKILDEKKVEVKAEQLKPIFPNIPQSMLDLINKYSSEFKINTPERMCHFLAQVGHETGNFRNKQEDGNYSINNPNWKAPNGWLNRKWFKCYCSNSELASRSLLNNSKEGNKFTWKGLPTSILKEKPKKEEEKKEEEKKEEKILVPYEYIYQDYRFKGASKFLSFIYQCEGGNGADPLDDGLGDGFKYSGKGAIQLTFKNNYAKFNNWLKTVGLGKYNVLDNPNLLIENEEISILSSMWYWAINYDLNTLADEGDPNKISGKINGASKTAGERDIIYKKLKEIIK